MTRIIQTLILFLLISVGGLAWADVLLTWDENPVADQVDMYQVEIDGQIVADVQPNTYSVINVSEGQHTARVRAHNSWGWGDFSNPLQFTKSVPEKPVNIRLEVGQP